MKSILDPSFQYTPSHQTDLRRTFERARREQETARVEPRAPRDGTASPGRDQQRYPLLTWEIV